MERFCFGVFNGYLPADGINKALGIGEEKMIWIILIIGTVLRSISLNQSLWLDEAINILATQKYSFFGMITEYAKADFHPPGYFVFIWIWTRLFGTSEIAIRLPSVIFASLTIYMVYLIGKKIYSKNLGLISALLLAINPLHIYYSQEARMYSFATIAVVLNFYLFLRILKSEKVNLLILMASNLFVLSSDYVAYLIFPVQILLLRKKFFKTWIKGIIISSVIFSLWLPVFLNQLNIGISTSFNLPLWKATVGEFDIKAIPLTLVKFIIGRISYPDKLIYYSVLAPICSFFLFLILRAVIQFKNYFLISWFLIPIFLASIISFIVPVFSYFRFLFVLPSFVILLALGINLFKGKLKLFFLAVIIVIEISSASLYLFYPGFQRENWRGLVSYLTSQRASLVLFESSATLAPFDYYSKNSLNALGGLKNFPAKQDGDVINIVGNDIFLIDYLVDISDPKRLVRKKLGMLGYILSETKDFHGVGFLYHYVK